MNKIREIILAFIAVFSIGMCVVFYLYTAYDIVYVHIILNFIDKYPQLFFNLLGVMGMFLYCERDFRNK